MCPVDEGSKVCDGGVSRDSLYLYEGQDWVISPSCSPEEPSAISPMLAEETFRYMSKSLCVCVCSQTRVHDCLVAMSVRIAIVVEANRW